MTPAQLIVLREMGTMTDSEPMDCFSSRVMSSIGKWSDNARKAEVH